MTAWLFGFWNGTCVREGCRLKLGMIMTAWLFGLWNGTCVREGCRLKFGGDSQGDRHGGEYEKFGASESKLALFFVCLWGGGAEI